jgi:hypothetical protein
LGLPVGGAGAPDVRAHMGQPPGGGHQVLGESGTAAPAPRSPAIWQGSSDLLMPIANSVNGHHAARQRRWRSRSLCPQYRTSATDAQRHRGFTNRTRSYAVMRIWARRSGVRAVRGARDPMPGDCVVAAVLGCAVGPASATWYAVTNTDDGGAGSLRWAIDEVNTHAGSDILWFDMAPRGLAERGRAGEGDAGGSLGSRAFGSELGVWGLRSQVAGLGGPDV